MNSAITSIPRRTFIAGSAALAAGLWLAPRSAFADDAASKQAEADAAYESLKQMQAALDEASNNYYQALNEHDEAKAKMDEASAQIDEKSKEISGYQSQLSTRARSMYRAGSNTFLDVLLGSASFEEFTSNWSILNDMNNHDAELVDQTRQAREELERVRDEYSKQEQIAAQKTEEAARIQAEAQKTVEEVQAVYDNLSAEAAELLEEERKAEEAAQAAQAAQTVAASAAGGSDYQEDYDYSSDSTNSSSNTTSNTSNANNGGGSSSNNSSSNSNTPHYGGGSDAVSRAYACLGAPYAWGACGPSSFDCSGLVSYALTGSYSRLGTTYTFMGWQRVNDPQPGDVATNSYHCGIYIGNGQMVHAADYGIGVIVGPVMSDMIIVRY